MCLFSYAVRNNYTGLAAAAFHGLMERNIFLCGYGKTGKSC